MRKVFLFLCLFLLLAQIATAQKTVLSDTSFITNNAGKFFETKETIYSNGESERVTNLIGDTSQVLTMYANAANVETKQFAACVAVVNGRNKSVQKVSRLSNTCNATTGKTIWNYLQSINEPLWIDTSATKNKPINITFKDGQNTKALVVTKLANGSWRAKIGTDAIRVFQLFGEGAIRILDYPTAGNNLHLWNIDNKIFTDYTGSIVLTRNN